MRLFRLLILCLFNASVLITAHSAHGETLHIAAASNFTHTLKALIIAFEKNSDHKVRVSYGSSGKIYAQIKHGAPFQLFLSADQEKPLALYKQGYAAEKPFTYALGALALWSSNDKFHSQELQRLTSGDYNKLAIANPKLAPYGIAAMQVLENLALTQASRKKWVQGENIAQAYQYVATGNADLGLVALSQVIDKKNYWPLSNELYQAIKQDALLLKSADNNRAAIAFKNFLMSEQGQGIIQNSGYQTLRSSQP
jgi:molybdate transport system substrate-binding protein